MESEIGMKLMALLGTWRRATWVAAALAVAGFAAGRSFDSPTVAAMQGEIALAAQDGPPPPPDGDDEDRPPPPRRGRPGGPGGPGGFPPPPPPPLMIALDKDQDGELSAKEIAGASEALKTLDKDGDGSLSHDELRPEPPDGPPPPRRGGRGPQRKGQGRPPRPPAERD